MESLYLGPEDAQGRSILLVGGGKSLCLSPFLPISRSLHFPPPALPSFPSRPISVRPSSLIPFFSPAPTQTPSGLPWFSSRSFSSHPPLPCYLYVYYVVCGMSGCWCVPWSTCFRRSPALVPWVTWYVPEWLWEACAARFLFRVSWSFSSLIFLIATYHLNYIVPTSVYRENFLKCYVQSKLFPSSVNWRNLDVWHSDLQVCLLWKAVSNDYVQNDASLLICTFCNYFFVFQPPSLLEPFSLVSSYRFGIEWRCLHFKANSTDSEYIHIHLLIASWWLGGEHFTGHSQRSKSWWAEVAGSK